MALSQDLEKPHSGMREASYAVLVAVCHCRPQRPSQAERGSQDEITLEVAGAAGALG